MRLPTPIPTVVLLLMALPVTTSAAQGGTASAIVTPAATPKWAPDKKNPYSKLFAPTREPLRPAPPAMLPPGVAGKPVVKCGMTMIPGDASIDPGIALIRPDSAATFSIQPVEPTICR